MSENTDIHLKEHNSVSAAYFTATQKPFVFKYASCRSITKTYNMFLGTHGTSQPSRSVKLHETEEYTSTTPLHTERDACLHDVGLPDVCKKEHS